MQSGRNREFMEWIGGGARGQQDYRPCAGEREVKTAIKARRCSRRHFIRDLEVAAPTIRHSREKWSHGAIISRLRKRSPFSFQSLEIRKAS